MTISVKIFSKLFCEVGLKAFMASFICTTYLGYVCKCKHERESIVTLKYSQEHRDCNSTQEERKYQTISI